MLIQPYDWKQSLTMNSFEFVRKFVKKVPNEPLRLLVRWLFGWIGRLVCKPVSHNSLKLNNQQLKDKRIDSHIFLRQLKLLPRRR